MFENTYIFFSQNHLIFFYFKKVKKIKKFHFDYVRLQAKKQGFVTPANPILVQKTSYARLKNYLYFCKKYAFFS